MAGIVNLLSRVLTSSPMVQTTSISGSRSTNPFASSSGNPFVTPQNGNPFAFYGKNRPVAGGYFAGYYYYLPNIVGRRLFIEV